MAARSAVRMLLPVCLTLAMLGGLSGPAALAVPEAGVLPVGTHFDARYGNVDFAMGRFAYEPGPAVRGSPAAIAVDFLTQHRDLYRMTDPARELAVVRTTSDALGQVHVRLRQEMRGVPVFAHSLYVHLDALGHVIGTNGHYVPDLALDTTPAIAAQVAEALALTAAGGADALVAGPARLAIYADAGSPQLAWQVEVFSPRGPERAWYFIAARGGVLVDVVPALMTDRQREIYDAQNEDNLPGTLIASEGERPRDAAARSAYDKAGAVYDYYRETHGRDAIDGRGGPMMIVVHFSQDYNFNFWDGRHVVFGDPDTRVRGASGAFALDVVAHEMTHGVVDYTAGLIYRKQSGALHESYADTFGVMLDREDWHYSEDAPFQEPYWPTPWAHDLEDPTLGGVYDPTDPYPLGQPAKMSDYADMPNTRDGDWGGVHTNGGIPSHAAYLVAQAMGGDVAGRVPVEHIWYRALVTYMTEQSDFYDFARAVLQSAKDLEGAYPGATAAVEAALEEVELAGTEQGTPAPEPSATPRRGTPVPQPTPARVAGCSELVGNNGFENPRPDPWVEHSGISAGLIAGDWPHTGKQSVWLGGLDDAETFQYIYQDVKIPANAEQATLSYWRYLHEKVGARGAAEITFQSVLADTRGNIIAELESFSSADGDDTWRQSVLDLTAYAGKTVRLAFTANTAPGNLSSLFVDDVSLQACTGNEAPPGPTPQPPGGIAASGHVVDYGTGDGIPGATVYVLRPGISATQAAEDGVVSLRSEVFTTGVADRDGVFALADPLAYDTTYSIIVLAHGYYAVIADDAIVTGDWGAVSAYDGLWVEMQPAR